jgi:hypothetical protein
MLSATTTLPQGSPGGTAVLTPHGQQILDLLVNLRRRLSYVKRFSL